MIYLEPAACPHTVHRPCGCHCEDCGENAPITRNGYEHPASLCGRCCNHVFGDGPVPFCGLCEHSFYELAQDKIQEGQELPDWYFDQVVIMLEELAEILSGSA